MTKLVIKLYQEVKMYGILEIIKDVIWIFIASEMHLPKRISSHTLATGTFLKGKKAPLNLVDAYSNVIHNSDMLLSM